MSGADGDPKMDSAFAWAMCDKAAAVHQCGRTPESDEQVPTLNLPIAGGRLAPYAARPPRNFPAAKPPFNRIAYAAAHVGADPAADADPWLGAPNDCARTICFHHHPGSLRIWL